MSYNENPYINEAADVYSKYIEPVKAVRREYAGAGDGVQMLYDAVMSSGVNITQDYRDWLTLACSLRNVPNGREMFHDLSTMDARYSRGQCDEQFDAVKSGSGITVSSFFWLAKKHGIQIKKY
jgi:hypothetical protein